MFRSILLALAAVGMLMFLFLFLFFFFFNLLMFVVETEVIYNIGNDIYQSHAG